MKSGLVVFISLLTLGSCHRKSIPVSSTEDDLEKAKEFAKAVGFDPNKITIELNAKVNPDSVLKFKSLDEAKAFFAEINKPRPANCFDTLKILSKSPGAYDVYLRSLKERARQTPFTAIPGYKPDEPQELPPGYEYMIFKDSDLPDSLKIPYTIKKATK
ncbi:hypothetical protein QEG73_18485 [Chitinophagaceae bacterium 26-R-25]|nr:hypothetical protein [Chitinophagaceae bacterium 26-R-25]